MSFFFFFLKICSIFNKVPLSKLFCLCSWLLHTAVMCSGKKILWLFFSMQISKPRLNLVEESSNDALYFPNSACHQVHGNTITHLLRNKMKIAKHLILIASDVHHIVTFHWLSVTAQVKFPFHANNRTKLNYIKVATHWLPAVCFDKTFCLLKWFQML